MQACVKMSTISVRTEYLRTTGIVDDSWQGGHVKLEAGELKVQLRRLMNSEIDYAARHICEDLNRMNPVTLDRHRLPIRYEVA